MTPRELDADAQQRVARGVRALRGVFECPGQQCDMPCDQGRACPNREEKPLPHGFAIALALVGGIVGSVAVLLWSSVGWWPL